MKAIYSFNSLMIVMTLLIVSFSPGYTSAQGDCTQTGLTNGGFEAFNVPAGNLGRPGPNGWTPEVYGFMEVWGSGFGGVPAYEGIDFVELNSNGPDNIYQDLTTSPGASYNWQVAHRGRNGVDVANLEFGPPGGPYTLIQSMSDGTTAWGVYSGTYTVPAGQTTTRVRLVSVSYGGGCSSCANFVDGFSFVAVDTDGDGTADCLDGCPNDAGKTSPGVCGCGTADVDSDGDGTLDCNDGCPNDAGKTSPGACGCGVADVDSDGDGIMDCIDNCDYAANGNQADSDCDGAGNTCDVCPGGNDMIDNNNDGLPDCHYLPAYADIIAAWKCGPNKVLVAHRSNNGVCHTICIDYGSVQDHLNHGDYIGPCGDASCSSQGMAAPDAHMSVIAGSNLDVFPNPAFNEINIQLDAPESGMIVTITDNFGRVVLTKQWEANSRNLNIDISDSRFQNGIYFVRASSDTEMFIQRFVVSK